LYAFQKFWQQYFAKNLDGARKFFYARRAARRIDDGARRTRIEGARRSQ
jgi:hypothetical protein